MPTINQLPVATQAAAGDELPLSQGGVTRSITLGNLLAGAQPAISVSPQTILGRISLGAGGPEPIALGTGLAIAGSSLAATGSDHAGFGIQPILMLTDEVILNSAGTPRRMPIQNLTGLYKPGSNITIDATGTISAVVPQVTLSPITSAPVATALTTTDRVGITQSGQDRSITLPALLAGADISGARTTPTLRATATSSADRAARRIDPRDFASKMFSGALSQDDAVGIQAAINFAQSQGGGIVELPSFGLVTAQIASPLVISKSGTCLKGQSRSLLTHDNLGPLPDAAVRLRWVGPSGGTMLRVAPLSDLTNGTPLSGCDISGFLLDCAGIAATGAVLASLQFSKIDLMVTEARTDGVLLDTIDLGEFNDCQNNELQLAIRIITTTGNCLRLAGSARLGQLGNTSYNIFRGVSLTHNAGDALVLDYADSNVFDKLLIQNRASFTTTTGIAGSGRAIVFKGSSEVVQRNGSSVALFGANSNVIDQLSCTGPIASLGQQSGYAVPATENRILRFDVGNNPLNLQTDTNASIQVSTTTNVDLALAAARPSVADLPDQVRHLRDTRGSEALAISSTTGDHIQFYSVGVKTWGCGIDGNTGDLRFAASASSAGQLNLGNGQGAFSLSALAAGGRTPRNPLIGGYYLYDLPAGQPPTQPPAGTSVIYAQAGTLQFWTGTGVRGAIGTPYQLRSYPVGAQAADIANCEAARGGETLSVFSTNGQYQAFYSADLQTKWQAGIDPLNNDLRFFPVGGTPGQINLGNGQGAFVLGATSIGARLPLGAPSGSLYLANIATAIPPAPSSGLALYAHNGALSAINTAGTILPIGPLSPSTATALGGVKVGANLTVSADGTLSAAAPGAGPQGAVGPTGPTGPAGPAGSAGVSGSTGPAWSPPRRQVAGTADTPSIADDQGIIACTAAQPTTITVNDLGSLRVYDILQAGAGSVTLTAASGVNMFVQGKAATSAVSAFQGAAISVISTGNGTVFVLGNTQ